MNESGPRARLTRQERRTTLHSFNWSAGLRTFYDTVCGGSTFVFVAFALSLGLEKERIGLITTVVSFACIVQMLGLAVANFVRDRKAFVLSVALGEPILMIVAVLAVPFLPKEIQLWALGAAVFLAAASLHLTRVPMEEIGASLSPDVFQRGVEQALLQLLPFGMRNIFEAAVSTVDLVKFSGAHGKHGTAFQHLHRYPHFKHVGCRGHGHVCLVCLGKHQPYIVRGARLDACLVHGSGHDVGGSHGEGCCRCGRSGYAAGKADAEFDGIAVFSLETDGQGVDGGEQGHGRTVVGMATRIGFGGYFLSHGDLAGEFCLFRRNLTCCHKLTEKRFGRRGKEFYCQLFTGHLGNDPVRRYYCSVSPAVDAVDPVTNQGKREGKKRRGLDQANLFADVEVGQSMFVVEFLRGVDQVDAVRQSGAGQPLDGSFDRCQGKARCSEEAEHSRPSQFFDHGGRADTLGH